MTMFQGVVPDDSHKDVATDGCNGWTLCSTVSTAQGPVRGPLGARMQNISRVTHYDFPVRRVRLKTRLFSRRTQGSMYLAVNGRDVWSKRRFKTDDCSALDGAWSTYNQLFDGTILTGTVGGQLHNAKVYMKTKLGETVRMLNWSCLFPKTVLC